MISRLRLFWRQIREHWVIVIIAALVVVIALIVTGYIFNWDWLGLNGYNKVTIATDLSSSPPKSTRTIEYQPGKTLWDWLQLIIVPVALGIITFWFNSLQKNIEDQRAQTQKEIEDQRAINQEQAGVLNTYIDDMSKLLLESNLRDSHNEDEVRIIAQTKTLTALDRLNSERRIRVLKFLYEAKLLDKVDPLIDLSAENYLEGLDLTYI